MEKKGKETRLLSAGIFMLLALSIISGLYFRERWLWMDEVLSYMFISDPSIAHMNNAVVSSMDANPPLFFNLYWLIGHTISLSPMFLRISSVLLFAGTIALFFGYITRLIGNGVTNFILISVMVYMTYQNFAHATGIRSYALLLPISLVYFMLMHQLISRPGSTRLLILHTITGGLMAFCHNYGLFYLIASGAFFLVLLLWSKQQDYVRVLATFVIIGIAWLVIWYPNFTIQSDAGRPHSWIPLPTVESFFTAIGDLLPNLPVKMYGLSSALWLTVLRVILVVGLYVYIAIPGLKAGFPALRQNLPFQFFLLSGFVYLTTIIIALTISFAYTSIFISRYMWPSQLLIMYQLVYAYYHFAGQRRYVAPRLIRLLPVYCLLLGGAIFYKVWKMQSPFPSSILTYLPQLSAQYPVFVERADYFLPIWFHKQRPNVTFLLNWQTANQPDNTKNATVDYKVLKSVREKYGVDGIVNVQAFNAAHFPHFYVIDEQNVYQIEAYLKSGQVKIIQELPIAMSGHRLLECSF